MKLKAILENYKRDNDLFETNVYSDKEILELMKAAVGYKLQEAGKDIKDYVKSLDKADNEVFRDNELLIKSCFAKAIEIIEKKIKCTGI